MIRFSTLGGIDLVHADGFRIHSVLNQPKRVALLAYLVIAGEGRVRTRDEVLAVLWPDLDEDTAKNRLKQAVHFLRRSLGDAALPKNVVDGLTVDPGILVCDALEYRAALRERRWADALELYQGDLLPAFHVEESIEFDSWLDSTRRAFRREAAKAALQLATEATAAQNASKTSHLVRRALRLSCDVTTIREGLNLLARLDDRVGIAEAYAEYRRRLAEELDMEPEAEITALVEEINSSDQKQPEAGPDGVYQSHVHRGAPATRPPAEPVESARKQLSSSLHRGVIAISGLGLAMFVIFALQWGSEAKQVGLSLHATSDSSVSVVVRNFESAGDSTAVVGARILQRLLRDHLADLGEVRVHGTTEHQAPTQTNGASGTSLSVEGIVRSNGDHLIVNLALISRHRGVIWAGTWQGSGDIDSEDIVSDMARQIRVEIGREIRGRDRVAGTPNRRALQLFELAEGVRRNARQMRARSLTAVALTGYAEADSLLAIAEALDPDWAMLVTARAQVAADMAWTHSLSERRNITRARQEMERGLGLATRAVLLAPGDPEALETRGSIAHGLELFGGDDRSAELHAIARDDLERAVVIDGSRGRAWSLLSDLAHRDGDFLRAYWLARIAFQSDQYLDNSLEILMRLFVTSFEVGDDVAAESWCSKIALRWPRQPPAAQCELMLLAWRETHDPAAIERAWAIIDDLSTESPNTAGPELQMFVAAIAAGAAMADSAEAVMSRAGRRAITDPEWLFLEAHVRALAGQPDSALSLLERYVAGKPSSRAHVLSSRRFSMLRAPDDGR